jgi:hypothetical protein
MKSLDVGLAASSIEQASVRVLVETLSMLCGDPIGAGIARAVYAMGDRVVKIESLAGSFQNVIEWETWRNLEHTEYARYLAPCHRISSSGAALVQSRVTLLTPTPDARTQRLVDRCRLPDFLTDFKFNNYGVLNGRIVCCDYGSNLLLNHGAFSSRLRKPKWRADND